MTTVTKKRYRPRGNNDSMSTISINTMNQSVNIADTTIITEPPKPETNRVEVHDLDSFINEQDREPPKTYKFVHTFNEYLRFFLIKALPLREKDMIIYHPEGTLEGPQAKCEKLIKKIKNQLQLYSVKIVKYNKDADIEEIEYHLQKKYDLKIYKRKFLQLTTKDIVQHYKFQEQSSNFLKRIQNQQIILVRVQKKHEEICIREIRQLITGEDGNKSVLNSSISSIKYQSQANNQIKEQQNNRYRQRNRQRQRQNEKQREEQRRRKERQRQRQREREREKQREKNQINKKRQREEQKNPKQNSKNQSSSGSEQIVEEDDDQPSYYHQKIKINSSKSDFRIPNFSKMEEPFEDDSISVVQAKRFKKEKQQNQRYKQRKNNEFQQEREQKGYNQKFPEQSDRRYKEFQDSGRKRKESKLRLIEKYQFQDLDQKDFTNWLQKNKVLSNKLVKLVTDEDPYDSTISTHSVQLYIDDDRQKRESQLRQAIEHYLKFRKVVMFKLQNDRYRDQLIQKYSQESEQLNVRYIKGYKSPKWLQAQMWKHIINKSYTDGKKSANTQYFQLFFIEGLKNLVVQIEKQIRNDLSSEPKEDQMQQIIIKFPSEISDNIRNNKKLQDLIRQTVEKLIKDSFKRVCQLTSVEFALSNLNISLKVKNDQLNNFQNAARAQIQNKVLKQIMIKDFDLSSQIDKHTYTELQKVAVIIHKQEKSFKYICSNLHLADIVQKMMNIINAQNRIAQKDLPVDDKIVVKKLNEYIQELIKTKNEYAEIKVNYAAEQGKFKFYGREYHIQMLTKELQQYIDEIDQKRINYYQIVKRRVGDMLEKDNIMKQISTKYDILAHVNQTELPCKIILSTNSESFKKKNILIIKSKSLDYAPCGSVIAFRGLDQVELYKNSYFMKTFRNYINKQKADVFNEHTRKYTMMIKQNFSVIDTLKEALNASNTAEYIVLIMPENGKEGFVKAIIKQLLENKKFESREVSIMIIEYGQSTDLLNQLKISPYVKGKKLQLKDQKLRKYYVQGDGMKFYYSDSGNRKILTASEKGFTKVILNNEDLNIMHVSHTFYTQNLVIIHKQSTKQFPIKINNTKVCFELKNILYEVPQVQADNILNAIRTNTAQLDLSLGVYEIDLTAMKQVNLFSDYERKLNFEQTIIKADVNQQQIQAFYNVKAAQIQYSYYFDDEILDNFNIALSSINSFLQNRIKSKEISYKQLNNIQIADLQGLKVAIEEDQQTQFYYNLSTKNISLKTLDETTLNRCEQMITMILKNQNDRDPHQIKYPVEWQPQKEDIETFQVNKNTKQFADVQKLFTVATIKSLHRIQNKIIYKKYYEQGVFLESLNGGKKVKTMRLFHGTRQTNPEQIYKDKEESFNINYSSDNNLLGKGIYFAERSEYSDNYKYTQVINSGKIFGLGSSQLHSMFLCQVLVGESIKCPQHSGQIKDTSYKDPVKKIKYESMTDFLQNSNIFVVYKSRRAYPLYLIKY